MVGDFAPKLADLTDGVLFGDVWERAELSKRDRSLVINLSKEKWLWMSERNLILLTHLFYKYCTFFVTY